jgi:hypothetical protein
MTVKELLHRYHSFDPFKKWAHGKDFTTIWEECPHVDELLGILWRINAPNTLFRRFAVRMVYDTPLLEGGVIFDLIPSPVCAEAVMIAHQHTQEQVCDETLYEIWLKAANQATLTNNSIDWIGANTAKPTGDNPYFGYLLAIDIQSSIAQTLQKDGLYWEETDAIHRKILKGIISFNEAQSLLESAQYEPQPYYVCE